MASFKTELTLVNINDGAPGATGAPGSDYLIETNQDEILKFYSDEGIQTLSPDQLTIKVSKVTGEVAEVQTLSKDNLEFSYLQDGEWVILGTEIWEAQEVTTGDTTVTYDAIIELDATQTTAIFNFNKIDSIYYAKLYNQIFSNESGIRARYQQNGILLALKIIGVRYGMNSEMARLSLKADGIYASIANSKLNFDANGLSVYNGGIKILKDEYETFSGDSFEEGVEYYVATGSGYVLTQDAAPQEGIQYYTKSQSTSLSADEYGNLTIVGSIYATDGYFNGEINATSGFFNGVVNAQSGNFSGEIQVDGLLTIGSEDNKIYLGTLDDHVGIFSDSYIQDDSKGFYIDVEGNIIANTIQLGDSATIKNFLKLGEYSYIYNPQTAGNGKVLSVRDIITLTEDGRMTLGDVGGADSKIILDGAAQSIQTNDFVSGYSGWKIDTDKAEFNHIVARGTIKSSVLSYGEVQTIGGVLLVRPSAIIEDCRLIEGIYVATLEIPSSADAGDFALYDFCKIGDGESLYQIIEIDGKTVKLQQVNTVANSSAMVVTDEVVVSEFIGKILISYGHNVLTESEEEIKGLGEGPIGIVINSTSNSTSGSPNAISIFRNKYTQENGEVIHEKIPAIVIGKMNGEEVYGGLTGYGLYADNAYLKGALVAASPVGAEIPDYYSGINTSTGVKMPESEGNISYFPEAQERGKIGEILFWAGAESNNPLDIAQAPFKVDTYGNLYANSGYFEGTIISNATISAAKIRTAVLEGWNLETNEQAALTIIDAARAIEFKKTTEDGQEAVLSLDQTKMDLAVPLTVPSLEAGEIKLESISLRELGQEGSDTETQLNLDELIFIRESNSEVHKTVISSNFDNKSLNFFVVDSLDKTSSNSESVMSLTQDITSIKNQTQFQKEIFFGANSEIEYRFVSDTNNMVIGYDVYIKE